MVPLRLLRRERMSSVPGGSGRASADLYFWSLVAVAAFVFSAASLVATVFLFTFCFLAEVNTLEGPQTICVIPHQVAAVGFGLLTVVLLGLGVYSGTRAWAIVRPVEAERRFVPLSGAPRKPDTSPPKTIVGRFWRGMAPRSWIEDYPAVSEPAPTTSTEDGSQSGAPP